MGERGFSLVEMLTVLAIMGILLAIAVYNWQVLKMKSDVESQIKQIHADLMELRLQALYSKTPRSVIISGTQYKVYATDDTSGAPRETKNLKYPIVWNSSGALTFDAQGLTNGTERTLCVLPTNDPTVVNAADVDSIVVSQARLNLGKRRGGDCKSANIDQK